MICPRSCDQKGGVNVSAFWPAVVNWSNQAGEFISVGGKGAVCPWVNWYLFPWERLMVESKLIGSEPGKHSDNTQIGSAFF